jgi:hypothetical protein
MDTETMNSFSRSSGTCRYPRFVVLPTIREEPFISVIYKNKKYTVVSNYHSVFITNYLLEKRLSAQIDAALLVDLNDLDLHFIADLANIFYCIHTLLIQFGNMD